MVLGVCHPDADFVIKGVSINPTRWGVIKILQAMGADLTLHNQREASR